MGRVNISLRNGIVVEQDAVTYALDPKGHVKANFTFVSHAHLDHVQNPDPASKVLASRETRLLAKARGFDLGRTTESAEGVRLLDSGHILGARAICVGDELMYTGDAAGRSRAFMGKCKTRKARILITECTFGTSNYVFPSIPGIVKQVNETIGTLFDRGRPVVLMGYALGKSQVLSHLFSSWSPLYFSEQVAQMNAVYMDCGVDLRKGRTIPENLDELPQGPWVMFTPMMGSRSKLRQKLKKDYGAAFLAFSGWAADTGYRYALGADYAFPISDHCDYQELLALVHDVSPEVVYTTHGFTAEFALDLRRQGFDAKPLDGHQTFLPDY